jgi:predicted O-linked N-acetylglucosamine transferase (SPINDLY family)
MSSWPVLLGDAFLDSPFYVELATEWLKAYENDHAILASFAEQHQLPLESVIHACANLSFNMGDNHTACTLLENALAHNSDKELHSLYLRCLMTKPGMQKKAMFDEILKWNALYIDLKKHIQKQPAVSPVKKITYRIGFICSYSHTHLMRVMFAPLLTELHHLGHDVYLFALEQKPLQDFEGVTSIFLPEPTTDLIVQNIREAKIDILVDIIGRFRIDNPLDVFLEKPAPVQISWGNMFCSYGFPQVGYILSDHYGIPPEDACFYTEKVFRFSTRATSCVSLPPQNIAPLQALDGHPFVFATFTAIFKLNDAVLNTWMQILEQTSHTCLLIKGSATDLILFQTRIHAFAKRFNVDPHRIRFGGMESFQGMLNAYDQVDLCLNPFPYTGGSTAMFALSKGVPTLTLFQKNVIAPGGGDGLFQHFGLQAFLANSIDEYIEKAIYWSEHLVELDAIRQSMPDRIKDSAFFNPAIFAKDFSDNCHAIWHDFISHQGEQHV